MAVPAPSRHRARAPRCSKHASAPLAIAPRPASGFPAPSAQVSVGDTTRGATETLRGHPLFGTRYYDPSVGRWTQQDAVAGSIGDPRTVNRYAYVGNDPVNLVDPEGLRPFWTRFAAKAAAATLSTAVIGGVCVFTAGWGCAAAVIGAHFATSAVGYAVDKDSGHSFGGHLSYSLNPINRYTI